MMIGKRAISLVSDFIVIDLCNYSKKWAFVLKVDFQEGPSVVYWG